MKNKKTKAFCNVCSKPIWKISSINFINSQTSHSWESDSTYEILNLSEIECFLGFCNNCYQSTIYPRFDTDLIYNTKGSKIREKYYEKYTKKKYKYNDVFENSKNIFELSSNELHRFKIINKMISKNFNITNKSEFTILDYAGGDGHISNIFAQLIHTFSRVKVGVKVYDLVDSFNKQQIFINNKVINTDSHSPINKGKYDLIIISHILEHSHDPRIIINKVRKLLKSDGVIFCEVPDERMNLFKVFYKKFGLHYHVTSHSRRSIHKLFHGLDFKYIKTKYFYNSSYRGNKTRTIVAIVGNKPSKRSIPPSTPSRPYEILSFMFNIIVYFIHKIS